LAAATRTTEMPIFDSYMNKDQTTPQMYAKNLKVICVQIMDSFTPPAYLAPGLKPIPGP
jgi:hypothetical protein